MLIREQLENTEKEFLSPHATLSSKSLGRSVPEEQCDIRTVFQRDRDRIIHSKAFRRLKDKTQVFLTPEGDHYRTRLTHTLEVSQNARTIAKALRLNEDLAEAIALGHDLGHTPFGHAGERALDNAIKDYLDGVQGYQEGKDELRPFGFIHSDQSVRVTELYERDGRGLNLTEEVKDGIKNHQTSTMPFTLEGKIVRLSDKLAYIHHDMDDAIRAKILTDDDVPKEIGEVLGYRTKDRLDRMIHDIVTTSLGKDDIKMSDTCYDALMKMRDFMFDRVYTNPKAKSEEAKAEQLILTLFEHFITNRESMPEEYVDLLKKGEYPERVVADYISSMTDRYAITLYNDIYVPKAWHG